MLKGQSGITAAGNKRESLRKSGSMIMKLEDLQGPWPSQEKALPLDLYLRQAYSRTGEDAASIEDGNSLHAGADSHQRLSTVSDPGKIF